MMGNINMESTSLKLSGQNGEWLVVDGCFFVTDGCFGLFQGVAVDAVIYSKYSIKLQLFRLVWRAAQAVGAGWM